MRRRRTDNPRKRCSRNCKIDLRCIKIGGSAAKTGFRLRHVGRSDVTGIEPLTRDAVELPEKSQIGTLRLDQGLKAEHIHIGGNSVQQYALLDIAQRLAAGFYLRFRLANSICGL